MKITKRYYSSEINKIIGSELAYNQEINYLIVRKGY